MSLCARTLDKEWGASCKCDEKSSDDANAIAAVKKHVKCGCTLKNCHAVAAFTLRRESGLAPGLTMDADDHVIARRAFSDIKRAQGDGFAAVSEIVIASRVPPTLFRTFSVSVKLHWDSISLALPLSLLRRARVEPPGISEDLAKQ